MTEPEWLATELPTHMIASGLVEWNDRKAFIAGSHCVRHWWHLLTDAQKRYVEAVECVALGDGNPEDAKTLFAEVEEEAHRPDYHANPLGRRSPCALPQKYPVTVSERAPRIRRTPGGPGTDRGPST